MSRIEKKLTRDELRAIVEIIHGSFDRDRIGQLFFLSLQKNLDDVVPPGSVWEVEATEIVRTARNREFIEELLDAVAASPQVSEPRRRRLNEIVAAARARPDPAPGEVVADVPVKPAEPAGSLGRLGPVLQAFWSQTNRAALVVIAAYAVLLTTIASVPVSTRLKVTMTPEQRQQAIDARLIAANGTTTYYVAPRPGFSIHYDDFDYAVDADGDVRINVRPLSYMVALISRRLDLEVGYPQAGPTRSFSAQMSWAGLSHIQLDSADDAPGAEDPGMGWEMGGSALASAVPASLLIGSAAAAPSGGARLYIQSVRVGKGAGDVVGATLTVGKDRKPLRALGADQQTVEDAQLSVVADAASIQNYRSFFDLPEPNLASGAEIVLEAPGFIFTSGYQERFAVSEPIPLGKPVELPGDRGGALVVQLLYPVDVIFFERRDTADQTRLLSRLVAEGGFAPRLNTRSEKVSGGYNVVYAGEDVSLAQLHSVVKVLIGNGVDIRSIQPNLQLKNGIQNQIQVGGSREILCYPTYTDEQKRLLLGSAEDFSRALASQAAGCG